MEWADLGEELAPTRAGSSDEGLSSVFAHQIAVFAAFLVFGFVICLLSLDMASGNAWNAALIDGCGLGDRVVSARARMGRLCR